MAGPHLWPCPVGLRLRGAWCRPYLPCLPWLCPMGLRAASPETPLPPRAGRVAETRERTPLGKSQEADARGNVSVDGTLFRGAIGNAKTGSAAAHRRGRGGRGDGLALPAPRAPRGRRSWKTFRWKAACEAGLPEAQKSMHTHLGVCRLGSRPPHKASLNKRVTHTRGFLVHTHLFLLCGGLSCAQLHYV